jgi:hypothetical protein
MATWVATVPSAPARRALGVPGAAKVSTATSVGSRRMGDSRAEGPSRSRVPREMRRRRGESGMLFCSHARRRGRRDWQKERSGFRRRVPAER